MKVIVLDLFAEIHKICVAKFSLYFEISIDSRFPESYWVEVLLKMNRSLWFFVYISGTFWYFRKTTG